MKASFYIFDGLKINNDEKKFKSKLVFVFYVEKLVIVAHSCLWALNCKNVGRMRIIKNKFFLNGCQRKIARLFEVMLASGQKSWTERQVLSTLSKISDPPVFMALLLARETPLVIKILETWVPKFWHPNRLEYEKHHNEWVSELLINYGSISTKMLDL